MTLKAGAIFGLSLQHALRLVCMDAPVDAPEMTVTQLEGFSYKVRCGNRTLDYGISQTQLNWQMVSLGSYEAVLSWHATKILLAFFPQLHIESSSKFP